jgi:Kef-type K+ transport system membrane component KefB
MVNSNTVHGVETTLLFILFQLVVILIAARLSGRAARCLGQPRAVGEIAAGLLLGPSFFGWLAPVSFNAIFHAVDPAPMSVMSQVGLILLMFQIGMEFDFQHLADTRVKSATALVTAFGIVVPFICGLGLAYCSFSALASDRNLLGYSLFLATALSITAVPILGRIMLEYDLTQTRIGVIAITSAAINDAIGWTILAVISAIVTARFTLPGFVWQLAGLLAYAGVSWFLVRRVLLGVIGKFELSARQLPPDLLAVVLVVVFTSAMVTSQLGIFAIFGGFMTGVLLHDQYAMVAAWKDRVADFVTVFFLPIFFTYTGLRTDVGGLDTPVLWAWCGLIFFVAVFAKFGGCYIASRLARLGHFEACIIGIMMNTRALMELIVVNIGYDLGVIPQPVFTMLVLMAIGSTLMTAPGLRAWLPRIGRQISRAIDA